MTFYYPSGYEDTLSRSHNINSKVAVYANDAALTISLLPTADASVSVDRTSSIRRTISGTFVASSDPVDDVTPLTPFGVIAPFGSELYVSRGIQIPAGLGGPPISGESTAEVSNIFYVPLGVFGLSEVDVVDEGSRKISFTAYDRSRRIARNKFTDPYIIAAGQNYGDAIETLILDRLPTVGTNITPTDEITPLLVIDAGADPWEAVMSMAQAIGFECFFNGSGTFVLQPIPDVATASVAWTYTDGQYALAQPIGARPTLLGLSKGYSDEPGYNGVVMTAESTTLVAPLRSVVWDTDPTSPTYYLGPYGQVPKFTSSPYVATQTGCDAAALAELRKVIGGTEKFSINVIPNIVLEEGDVIQVNRAVSGVTNLLTLIESMEIPLSPSQSMTINGTQRRAA